MHKYYSPRRDGRPDAAECVEQPDGSWRNARGQLIYMPVSNCGIGLSGAGQDHPDRIHPDHAVFEDQTWNAYADERRLQAPEVHYPASLEGIRDWLVTQGVV